MKWIFFLLLTLPSTADAVHFLKVAPAVGAFTISKSPNPADESGCYISLDAPTNVKIHGETPTHFEIEWLHPMNGCLWQRTFGLNIQRGWVKKDDLVWDQGDGEELPMITPPKPEPMSKEDLIPKECEPKEELVPNPIKNAGIGKLVDFLDKHPAGMKTREQLDKYLNCYPKGKTGKHNYNRFKRFIDMASDCFTMRYKTEVVKVNGSLLRCLIRQESGFELTHSDPAHPATGLGQHLKENIDEINSNINTKGSWEKAIWAKCFNQFRQDPEANAMLNACPGSAAKGELPKFQTKADAACPLQSIAATSLFNLQIRRRLLKQAKKMNVEWEDELDYHVAQAAAHNMGPGAAAKAVKDVLVNNWLDTIRKKSAARSPNPEVLTQIRTVKTCLEAGNWQPMYAGDAPQCEELKYRAPAAKAKVAVPLPRPNPRSR